jgi:[protein-PII] uridylyltransferase
MILHGGRFGSMGASPEILKALTGVVIPLLWDAGLKVGHSTRTPAECVAVANSDMQSKTSLLEARCVVGDEWLYHDFLHRFAAHCVKGCEAEYVRQRLEDQEARRARHGGSPAMQEPNIKNGCGGLRDYQNLLWMVAFRFKIGTMEALQAADQISAAERRQLEAAYNYLLRTRNELHYCAGRGVDVLTAAVKPDVASGLGYNDRSVRVRVERFMHDFYGHTRNIHLITRTLEQRLALTPAPARRLGLERFGLKRRPVAREAFDGFEIANGWITAAGSGVFREDPFRLIRVFLHSQQRGKPIHPDLAQLLRQSVNSGMVNGPFIASAHARNTFLELLNARGNVAPSVRAMHDVGFLGRLLPEFGRLTNLVQHEFYHQYAVDEHTLRCVDMLDRVWDATEAPFKNYAPLLKEIERPYVLYLALLLHDSGKAHHGERHELVGGRLAQRAGNRLHLPAPTTATLRLIIENHLAMVQISQRRDLDDDEVIRNFASVVGTKENLDLLTLHTFADSKGTSDTLWNGFKDSLLWQLRNKARDVLAGGSDFIRAERLQLERLEEDTRALLPKTFGDDEIGAHFKGLPARYFHVRSPREVARDLTLAHRFMHLQLNPNEVSGLAPVVIWREEPDRGYAALNLCTWDRPGLFANLTGALAVAGLSILSAQIYTRTDGVVLDEFLLIDARTGEIPETAARTKFEKLAAQILTAGLDPGKVMAQAPRLAPRYRPLAGEAFPTDIRFDNEVARLHTVVDLVAEDRVGLLYALSSALFELGLDLSLAKIVTEKGVAIDSFYVTDRSGAKITDPRLQKAIVAKLNASIDALTHPR